MHWNWKKISEFISELELVLLRVAAFIAFVVFLVRQTMAQGGH